MAQAEARGRSGFGFTPSGEEAVGGAAAEVRGPGLPSRAREETCAVESRSREEAQVPRDAAARPQQRTRWATNSRAITPGKTGPAQPRN